ncbi:hypothetical protein CL653_03355 [bacterium]|nr:hypothetical protein [bacterium]|tara:strand:+ start:137 stop:826 length:690 start_codon:yes stop_codon:yes gene_type:complete
MNSSTLNDTIDTVHVPNGGVLFVPSSHNISSYAKTHMSTIQLVEKNFEESDEYWDFVLGCLWNQNRNNAHISGTKELKRSALNHIVRIGKVLKNCEKSGYTFLEFNHEDSNLVLSHNEVVERIMNWEDWVRVTSLSVPQIYTLQDIKTILYNMGFSKSVTPSGEFSIFKMEPKQGDRKKESIYQISLNLNGLLVSDSKDVALWEGRTDEVIYNELKSALSALTDWTHRE